MLQTGIETLANIVEAAEKAHAKHWYDGIIMKTVIFNHITFTRSNGFYSIQNKKQRVSKTNAVSHKVPFQPKKMT